MEFDSYKNSHDENISNSKRGAPEDDQQDVGIGKNPKDQPDSSAEVNMEFAITPDDIMRAGGFGATDDMSSILPGAGDYIDFENHLHDVQGYDEESEDKIGEDNVESKDAFGEVNMEASVTSDEVTRAGGFGATDNISSFLPVASDFTDFEANLRDARDYEDSQEKISRPGLGWKSETN